MNKTNKTYRVIAKRISYEYLYNEAGDNCFDKLSDAQQLIDDAVLTVLEHQGD